MSFCSIVRDKTFIFCNEYWTIFINIVTGAVNLSDNGLIIIKRQAYGLCNLILFTYALNLMEYREEFYR